MMHDALSSNILDGVIWRWRVVKQVGYAARFLEGYGEGG